MGVFRSFAILHTVLIVFMQVNGSPLGTKERKCIPKQWESLLFGKITIVNQGETVMKSLTGAIAYDYINGRLSLAETIRLQNGTLVANEKAIILPVSSFLNDHCSNLRLCSLQV